MAYSNEEEGRHDDFDLEGKRGKAVNVGGLTGCLPNDRHEADKKENDGPKVSSVKLNFVKQNISSVTMRAIQRVEKVE